MGKFDYGEPYWKNTAKKNPTKYGRTLKYLIEVRQLTTHRLKDYFLQHTLLGLLYFWPRF